MLLKDELNNVNIVGEQTLISPEALKQRFPLSATSKQTVIEARQAICDILNRKKNQLIVVVGPCSIHDERSAKEYATRLKQLRDELQETLFIVMRVYFEKPRTTVGWKGFINDPYMNDSFEIGVGLENARKLLLWINDLGLPAGTEALDPISPQYLSDLISWVAIGARTSESQTHREMASGLSMPVGFKNGTDGNLAVAINALQSAASPHSFLGLNQAGQVVIARTRGNQYGHIILRGGQQPNYDSVSISLCEAALAKAKLANNIMVDCSHSNSHKKYELQPLVAENVAHQILEGNQSIIGIMLESHLHEGNQPIPSDLSQLKYGVSVTDACINWEMTEKLLRQMHAQLRDSLAKRTV